MEITFLGTGSAWGSPEHSCECAVCAEMNRRGEERTRTSFLVRTHERILVDCGPDLRLQMRRTGMERPDAVLITHEHADHFLGLDDLLAFRRAVPENDWVPIPVYATEQTWASVEQRFGYLMGSLIEKRVGQAGAPCAGITTRVVPFATYHGPSAPGSVGYVVEEYAEQGSTKLVYTSDFSRIDEEPEILIGPDVLIMQAHWLSEPHFNRPNHMSLQAAVDYILRWEPQRAVYLIHISPADVVPGDPHNNILQKLAPDHPFGPPGKNEAYPVPRCHAEWVEIADRVRNDYNIPCPMFVTYDGMTVRI